MLKKTGLAVFFAAFLIILHSVMPQETLAAERKISLAITNRCQPNTLQLFITGDQRDCILAKYPPQKYKRQDSETPTVLTARSTSQQQYTYTTAQYTPTTETSAQPTIQPTVQQITPPAQDPQAGLNADVLFEMVNAVRIQSGLTPFEKDTTLCEIAQSRAPELTAEIFGGYMHAGFYNRNLPYWATENMIHMNTEAEALNWWMNSSVHRSAILGDYKFSCTACQGKSCCQIFTSYLPK